MKFIIWLIQATMCMALQLIGNNMFPDLKNIGIVIALLFILTHLYDTQLNNKEAKQNEI